MKTIILISTLVCSISFKSLAMKLPGPRVYVVTPSPRTQIDEGRSAPFYYHNWMRRMDAPHNDTTSTTSSTPTTVKTQKAKSPDLIFAEFDSDHMKNIRKLLERERISVKTTTTSTPSIPIHVPDEPMESHPTTIKTQKAKSPDLIFAEFDSDHMKNIRKLLERERISVKTTTTSTPSIPIYVPDEPMESQNVDHELPSPIKEKEEMKPVTKDKTNYFALYNNLYDSSDNLPSPVYVTSATPPVTTTKRTTTTSTTTEKPTVNSVENIWHIIDSEKHDQYEGQWDEVPISSEDEHDSNKGNHEETKKETDSESDDDSPKLGENFALPGFSTNSGNDAENESRAIRTEPNTRFPYVNLKPFKMETLKKPLLKALSNSKKGNNMYTGLDNFFEIKNPVRGEVEDKGTIRQPQQPIDRYNPAQPYLPSPEYFSKSKQSSPNSPPVKMVANLVPPPPPAAPPLTADDFPAPVSYESFPPYAQAGPAPAPPKPISRPQPPAPSDDSDMPPQSASDDDDGPSMDLGYRYKPPSPPLQPFLPTVSPSKPAYGGYSYDKPSMAMDSPPDMDDKPDFQGYEKPAPVKPFSGYHYSKPEPPSPPMDHPPSSYGSHDSDYPELIYDKPHAGSNGMKGGDGNMGMQGGDDNMGMMPPPAPSKDVKPDFDLPGPPDDNGFPHDFPSDFRFPHDFDHDHDHDFYHHHHTTTTTTTTEMPRVNRYSYYYLGKKLYYLPLYFSVYFIIYVGALIIKAVLRHKITYPNSFRPNDDTASFFSKRSVDSWDLSKEHLHEITGRVTHAIATAAEKYISDKSSKKD